MHEQKLSVHEQIEWRVSKIQAYDQ